MHVAKCGLDITVGDRLRPVDPEKVAALAESIAAIGLQQPISVWAPDLDALHLVAGRHRLEAVKSLGWDQIDCIYVDLNDLDRQLWEIDENLCRSDLTDLERAQHTAKRAEVVRLKEEAKKLETKPVPNLKKNKGQGKGGGPKSKGLKKFVKDTAKATGRSEMSVKKDKARGEKIAPDVQKEISGTKMENSGVQLDALAKATHEEQREAVKAVSLGNAKDVREVLPGAKDLDREKVYKNLCNWWKKADKVTRAKFKRNWINSKEEDEV